MQKIMMNTHGVLILTEIQKMKFYNAVFGKGGALLLIVIFMIKMEAGH